MDYIVTVEGEDASLVSLKIERGGEVEYVKIGADVTSDATVTSSVKKYLDDRDRVIVSEDKSKRTKVPVGIVNMIGVPFTVVASKDADEANAILKNVVRVEIDSIV